MELPSKRPTIEQVASRLEGLKQVPAIAKRVLELTSNGDAETDDNDLEATIYNGYGELITYFNHLEPTLDHEMLIPHALKLKQLLNGVELPSFVDISARDLINAIGDAKPRMLQGQTQKQRRKEAKENGTAIQIPDSEINHAIGAPSVDTSLEALAVGTAGHLIERAMFAYLKRKGLDTDDWVKDQILWALEDLALYKYAEAVTYRKIDEPLLIGYIAKPPDIDGGGMGWRTVQQVQGVIDTYKQLESTNKAFLLIAYEHLVGEAYHDNLTSISYADAVQDICANLLYLGYDNPEHRLHLPKN